VTCRESLCLYLSHGSMRNYSLERPQCMRSVRRSTDVRWCRWRNRSPDRCRKKFWWGTRPRWRRFALTGGRWGLLLWSPGTSGGWSIDKHVTVYPDRCVALTSVVLMEDVVLVVCAVLQTTHTERGVPVPYQVKEDKVLTLEVWEGKVLTLEVWEDKVSILEAVEDKVSILDHKALVTAPVDLLGEGLQILVVAVEVPVEHVEGRQDVLGEEVALCVSRCGRLHVLVPWEPVRLQHRLAVKLHIREFVNRYHTEYLSWSTSHCLERESGSRTARI